MIEYDNLVELMSERLKAKAIPHVAIVELNTVTGYYESATLILPLDYRDTFIRICNEGGNGAASDNALLRLPVRPEGLPIGLLYTIEQPNSEPYKYVKLWVDPNAPVLLH